MMELGLSERWILLADITNSTHFFWELKEAGRQKHDVLFQSSMIYSGNIEAIFNMMSSIPKDWLATDLGNTMGDGFILVGKHGHGTDHIRQDAAGIIHLAREVKVNCDAILTHLRGTIAKVLEDQGVPRQLPELKMKVSLHHGYIVTIMQSQRFFGDTVNYSARVMRAAFDGWNGGVALTKDFANVLPDAIRKRVERFEIPIEIQYPSKKNVPDVAFRINLSETEVWSEVQRLAGITDPT